MFLRVFYMCLLTFVFLCVCVSVNVSVCVRVCVCVCVCRLHYRLAYLCEFNSIMFSKPQTNQAKVVINALLDLDLESG